MHRLITLCLFVHLLALAPASATPVELYDLSGVPEKGAGGVGLVGAIESAAVRLDASAVDLAPTRLVLPLLDGRRLEVERTDFAVENGYTRWVGETSSAAGGPRAHAHLVDHGDQVSGSVLVDGQRYRIAPTAEGRHRLVRVEPSRTPVCALDTADEPGLSGPVPWTDAGSEPETTGFPASHIASAEPGRDQPTGATPTKATPTAVDVLAIYTADFCDGSNGGACPLQPVGGPRLPLAWQLENFIDSSVSRANSIFVNSRAEVRYNLVGKVKLVGEQPDATGLTDAIAWLNGDPSEVRALRDAYAADMVALFIPHDWDEPNKCGIANLPDADGNLVDIGGQFGADRAYSVHRDGCGLDDYTFAHELGHNFALRHQDESATQSNARFAAARGHSPKMTVWAPIADGTLQKNVPGRFLVGFHFTPLSDVVVTKVGGLFPGNRVVRIAEAATGGFVTGGVVSSNNAWRYSAVQRRTLVGGTRYTIYVDTTDTDPNADPPAHGGSIYSNISPLPRIRGPIRIESSTALAIASAAPGEIPTSEVFDTMYGVVDLEIEAYTTVLGCLANRPDEDPPASVCDRIPYLSNPGVWFDGLPTGTSDRNNAGIVSSCAPAYADFRPIPSALSCQTDYLTTAVDTPLSVSAGELLGNDSGPAGRALSLADYDRDTLQGGRNDSGHLGGFNYTPRAGFVGTDRFSYTVSNEICGFGQRDTCFVYVEVGGSEVFAQAGRVTDLTHASRTILFGRQYANPVVIAQTPSRNGADTSVVRITDVRSDRFTMHIDEAPNRDGTHTTESVAWMVVEAGSWRLADGTLVQAGRQTVSGTVGKLISNQWTTLGFPQAFTSAPVVVSQVQSNNDPGWVKTRHLSVDASTLRLGLEEDEASATRHGAETVGWLAIEPGSGTWGGRAYVAGRSADVVTHDPYTISFGGSYPSPRVFAAMSSYDGGDNAALRYTTLTSSSVSVMIEEDDVRDAETAHTSEMIDYLVISGDGVLEGTRQ